MESYYGKICNCCGKELRPEDEVIICPACKKAHHVSCWIEKQGCATEGCTEQNPEAQQDYHMRKQQQLQQEQQAWYQQQVDEIRRKYKKKLTAVILSMLALMIALGVAAWFLLPKLQGRGTGNETAVPGTEAPAGSKAGQGTEDPAAQGTEDPAGAQTKEPSAAPATTEAPTEAPTEPETTAASKKLSKGLSLSSDSFEVKILSIDSLNTLKPPKPDGVYTYFTASSGKTFLVVKIQAKNIGGDKVAIDKIASASCIYKDKYNYSASCVFEEDGGEDLNSHPGIYGVSPLDTVICYYLIEVPSEAKSGPYTITFTFDGENYEYKK